MNVNAQAIKYFIMDNVSHALPDQPRTLLTTDVTAEAGKSGSRQQTLVHAQQTGPMITLADVINALKTKWNQEDIVAQAGHQTGITGYVYDARPDHNGVTTDVCALVKKTGGLM